MADPIGAALPCPALLLATAGRRQMAGTTTTATSTTAAITATAETQLVQHVIRPYYIWYGVVQITLY